MAFKHFLIILCPCRAPDLASSPVSSLRERRLPIRAAVFGVTVDWLTLAESISLTNALGLIISTAKSIEDAFRQ